MINTIFIIVASLLLSCNSDTLPTPENEAFNLLDPKLFYQEDPFATHAQLYGSWKFVESYGGFMGTGYPLDFDDLLLKPNGIFGIQRNDSLITYGYLDVQPNTPGKLIVYFKAHDSNMKNITLLGSDEKTIELTHDSLFLRSPCCDMYDEMFVRNRD